MDFSSTKLIKGVNGFWYTAVSLSLIVFLITGFWAACSLTGYDIKMPVISFQQNNFSYRFNSKYLIIYNIDEILHEYTEYDVGDARLLMKWKRPYVESLFNLPAVPPLPDSMKKYLKYSRMRLIYEENYPYLVSGYYELKEEPEFVISSFFLITSYLFFGLLIIYNLKKILSINSSEMIFNANNSNSIRFIGIYLILTELLSNLLFYWMKSSVIKGSHHFPSTGEIIPIFEQYSFTWSEVNFGLLFAGVITIMISEIFRIGAKLKEDVDLAI